MPIYFTADNKFLVGYNKGEDGPIKKYRPIISKLLIEKFGKGPFKISQVAEALFFTFDWYVEQFLSILKNETELSFYQGLFLLHEFSCEFHRKNPNKSPIPQITDQDFALYRRILKLCLEQACDIPLKGGNFFTPPYLKVKEIIIEDLLYLGEFIYTLSNLFAQQHLIEDSVVLKYTEYDQYYFDHKHHYGLVINEILKSFGEHLKKAITGVNDLFDFAHASKKCLGVEFEKTVELINLVHENFKSQGGKLVLDKWYIYPKNLENLFGIPYNKGATFFKGLTLSKENKMSLRDAVYKPQNINRYLYRPFLVWNIDGNDLTIVGDEKFRESIMSLCTNAFSWNKYPSEWENDCFKDFIKQKVFNNDKVLEDVAEKFLKDKLITYDRNVAYLRKWNNRNLSLEIKECGELDFIFILDNKIFIADSKHLSARYDMNNFKNDYSSFEKSKKAYNKILSRKLAYLNKRIEDIQEHFQVVMNNKDFVLDAYILEGIFIVNTPTFIMYNNEYRIYTIKSFEEFLSGNFIDPIFQVFIEENGQDKFYLVEYPYFKKPS